MKQILYFSLLIAIVTAAPGCKKSGCTNQCATNYVDARKDDGSCTYAQPIFDYKSFYVLSCSAPYSVDFYTRVNNTSCIVNYEWDFGDGSNSTLRDPRHVYTSSGTYTVTLRAKNVNAEAVTSFQVILDTSIAPISSFSIQAENENLHAPANIKFYNYSSYSNDFYWDFGDGTSDTGYEPSHVYNSPGHYVVSLKSRCGNKETVYSSTVDILPKPTLIALTSYHATNGGALSADKGTPLYMEMQYNNNPILLSQVYLFKSYPVSFLFPEDVFSGTYKVNDIFLNGDNFRLVLLLDEINGADRVLFNSTVDFAYLSSHFYPGNIVWESSGYRVEANFEYH